MNTPHDLFVKWSGPTVILNTFTITDNYRMLSCYQAT